MLTRARIYEAVWGGDLPDQDTHTIETHVYRLRKSLGRLGGRIKAANPVGYKWEEE